VSRLVAERRAIHNRENWPLNSVKKVFHFWIFCWKSIFFFSENPETLMKRGVSAESIEQKFTKSSPKVQRKFTKSSPEVHQKFIKSSPEVQQR